MAVPKRKTSVSRRNQRRSHHALQVRIPVVCKNCGEHKLPHHICAKCGFYRNKVVISKVSVSSPE